MLVERDAESEILANCRTECSVGRGGAVTVSGPVGSGKTALLGDFAHEAIEAGYGYLSAKGSWAERDVPMGLIGQVFDGAGLSAEVADEVSRLLDNAALTAGSTECPATEQAKIRADRGLTAVLLELAERAPLLIGIDDAHLADAGSMRYLLYLVRRIDRARILIVLNESGGLQRDWPMFAAELRSQPNSRQLRLSLLSPAGVATVLRGFAGLADADPMRWHQASGGNPALLNALLEDHRHDPTDASPAGGPAFAQAALACLYRGGAAMLPVAQALAVLDEPATPGLLNELLRDICVAPDSGLAAMTDAGLLQAGRFRHPRTRPAVLDAMTTDDRADLHERVARLLYGNGAPAVAVARHKLAARRAEAPWSVPLLREAAEQALREDDTPLALEFLRLAQGSAATGNDVVRIQSALLRASWRLDPAAAERHTPVLIEAALAGRLPIGPAALLVNHLMWFGRPAKAAEVFDAVIGTTSPDNREAAIAMHTVQSRFAYVYPELAGRIPAGRIEPRSPTLVVSTGRLRGRTADIVDAIRGGRITEDTVNDARAILEEYRLDDNTYDAILAALEVLVHTECLETAVYWCDALLEEAEYRRVPTWCALLSVIRSVISFRQGDLAESERHATAALARVQPKGLGVFIGVPLAVLLLSATRRGEFDEALRLFAVPVPDVMFQTPFGLYYLRARGRFHLARGSHRAAIEDFQACGELMGRWGIDMPGLVPWRTDLAEARIALDLPVESLISDQLALIGPHNRRTRGISLRVLAATKNLQQRLVVLRDAVDELQFGGDQLELVQALNELSEVQQALGEYTKARVTMRRAQQIATKHDLGRLVGGRPDDDLAAGSTGEHMIDELSDAERRVAALAARGDTNQQIARKLFITVSTVEQHLTRVYRKLQINRRSDLPFTLAS